MVSYPNKIIAIASYIDEPFDTITEMLASKIRISQEIDFIAISRGGYYAVLSLPS